MGAVVHFCGGDLGKNHIEGGGFNAPIFDDAFHGLVTKESMNNTLLGKYICICILRRSQVVNVTIGISYLHETNLDFSECFMSSHR